WPRDLLPQDVPGARILVFGYNSNVAFNVSNQSTREHANALLERLSASRASPQARIRPIIFVGHSLGGLLIKQALVNAKLNWKVYSSIRESTRGLVFFGTPHQGGNGVTLGKIAVNIVTTLGGKVSNDLLLYLEKDSVLTQNTNDDFRHQVEDYRFVSFFETRKTRLKKSGFLGLYLNVIVVDAKSAKMGVGSREVQLSMDLDHTMMNKFGGRDHMYEPVGGQIGDLVKYCIDEEKRRKQACVLAALPTVGGKCTLYHPRAVRGIGRFV
ncbi:hypothetical protein BDD12DRAFT_767720, partial [Trichophaea hybrida]